MLQEALADQLSEMASWQGSRLMTFDVATRHVKTQFNDTLVVLLREVQQLQAMGYSCRGELQKQVDVASGFYR